MNQAKIILASQSPRRKELLAREGIAFTVYVTDADETVSEDMAPNELVAELSYRKAQSAAQAFLGEEVLVVAADTVVALDNEIFGKPVDEADARRMLQLLSGKAHSVFTGVTLAYVAKEKVAYQKKVCETKVYFYPITEEEIAAYINTGEPFDKAGSYAIQGIASKFVKKIEGDFDNVVGLPVFAILEELQEYAKQGGVKPEC
ncbi:MAG: septum formation protein Maf [Ruminococcaceae bacterium]|nr:septum formation protein Maf [Oscillospiraceae bacterium]